MTIKAPKAGNYPDRQLDCEMALEDALQDIIEEAQTAGWKRTESMDAIESLVANFRKAYDEDPDPADDPA